MLPRIAISFAVVLPACIATLVNIEDELNHQANNFLRHPIHQPEVYTKAVSILESFESSPSCHRLAALALINSCQSLDSSASAEVHLTEIREEYAAKLAMCELMSAKVSMPPRCMPFVATESSCQPKNDMARLFRRRSVKSEKHTPGQPCYPEVSYGQVKDCLSVLHSRPTWWTSYSNANQNAMILCQASRGSIEKDEILETFRSSTNAIHDISEALANSVASANGFMVSVQELQQRHLRDWAAQSQEAKSAFGRVIVTIQNAVNNMLQIIDDRTAASSVRLSSLDKQIAIRNMELIRNITLISELLAVQTQTMNDAQAQALARVVTQANQVEHSLRQIVDNDTPALARYLEQSMNYLTNFTDLVAGSITSLETQIDRNGAKLQQQSDQLDNIGVKMLLNESEFLWVGLCIILLVTTQHASPPVMKAVISSAWVMVVGWLVRFWVVGNWKSILLCISYILKGFFLSSWSGEEYKRGNMTD